METKKLSTDHVIVAMSGGVDSSVAAAILHEQGYRVTGVMMRTWVSGFTGVEESRVFAHAQQSAQNIAKQLQIPFHVLDVTKEFKKAVLDYFVNAHVHGLTPNPCFVCNRQIKWGLLLKYALEIGGTKLASGHYARVKRGEDGQFQLYRAVDKSKDQSYVLAGLDQSQLSRVMFPLGEITKSETRAIAHRYSFHITKQEESQDLCFLEGQSQDNFLACYVPELFTKGVIKNTEGKVIGEHDGLALYTIGQRKGIMISHSEPYYVVKKDMETNTLIVGTKLQLGIKRLRVSEVNWISGFEPALPVAVQVKVRYRSLPTEAVITREDSSGYNIIFKGIARDPTPGQYAVFYDDQMVIGSGVIAETYVGED